ncbi:MAG: RidA family protein [Acidobacteria bacterium]|nr:RidA family protein [Acidobacteriota bacterium]
MRWTVPIVILLVFVVGPTLMSGQKLERINPAGLSTPQTYSHIIKAGKLLFIAGQVGATPDGKVAGPGMKEQLEQVLKNLATALKSQGADFSHVAKITIFVTSVPEFRAPEVAAVRAKYFGDNKPASTLVQIQQLASPDYKVEIETVAVLP